MARISINFTNVGSTTPETWRETEGIDLLEFLEGAQITPRKVTVYLNGSVIPTEDLADTFLDNGDDVKITAQNYASGTGSGARC